MIELRSTEVPPVDRFGWWCAVTEREMAPTLLSSDRTDDFYASVTILRLGHAIVTAPEFEDMCSTRTSKLIRRSDPEQWWLTLVCAGSMWLEQDGNRARLAPGDLVLESTSRPFRCGIVSNDGELARSITLQIPRQAVPLPDRLLRGHVARAMSSAHGAGALLARFMESLLQTRTTLGQAENARLGTVVSELATLFLTEITGATDIRPTRTRQQAQARQIKHFVRENLARPDLSPSVIASVHHISVRSLHLLFQNEGQSIGQYIRYQRLERCRVDLADPLLSGRTVAQIAARWGFPDAASFNRAFKTAFGMPPGEYRGSLLSR
ncbi:helix-turn-helix domain-containing protein [Nonomuraea jabiensis]|uniref:helix-turn-helix domain-containing protein n=1 Tax=Nonomuraea jabiensis TaxID=882448 RepID=UPI00367D58E4